MAALAAWTLLVPPAAPTPEVALVSSPPVDGSAPLESRAPLELVVDVEGGVMQPGIQRLPPGARVADAIAAAGGYSPAADLDAMAATLNLAQPMSDGEQIVVPLIGEEAAAETSGPQDAGGGLVDLNSATPEELEALPGIGPVTVQKIVAARQEQPFASLDDAAARGVIDRGQLEQIRELATAG